MIKKGDNEIVALFKGDTEVEQLYKNGTLIYDADRICASIDDNTLYIETVRHASFDSSDDSLALRSKAWGKVDFTYNVNNKKIIKIQQHERQ